MAERPGFRLKGETDLHRLGFSTRAIHDGQEPDRLTGSVIVPIYQTSTYAQDSPGKTKGYEYSRTGNPTRAALEKSIASLENAKHGLAFSSGMAAISTIASTLSSGQSVLLGDDLYGGTYRVFAKVFSKFKIRVEFADPSRISAVEKVLSKKNFSYALIETPTNPLLKIVDIPTLTRIAHSNGTKVIVDNTFSTPYITTPLDFGADVVVHSTTKYLGGHSDVVGGALATNDKKIFEDCKFLQNAIGAVPGPFDCWLVLRGIKTLSLRMQKHSENARAIAEYLKGEVGRNRSLKSVKYPGLREHVGHDLAKRQMRTFGGMISVQFVSEEHALSFINKLKIFSTAESLGGVESLAEIPGIMTHASLPEKERSERGISKSLVRLSVGIEDELDLLGDVKQAIQSLN
jgi:cystathionine gamma-lyase